MDKRVLTQTELNELKSVMKEYSKVCEQWDVWCMNTYGSHRMPRILRLFDRKITRLWHIFDTVVDAFDYTKVKPL